MQEITLTNGKTEEYDEIIIHESGWVECKEMNSGIRFVKDRQHYPPHMVETIDEDTMSGSVKYK